MSIFSKKNSNDNGDSFSKILQDDSNDNGATIDHDTQQQANDGPDMGPEPESGPSTSSWQMLCPVIAVTAAVLVPNWKLQPDEITALAQAYDPVLDKYLGTAWLTGPEAVAILVTGNIVISRLGTPRKAPETDPEPEPVTSNAE